NQLGGDDFDDLLLERLEREFQNRYGIDLRRGHPAAHARLWWAAEEGKKKLSFEPYVQVREEALVIENGRPLHLDLELSRPEHEVERVLVDVSPFSFGPSYLAERGGFPYPHCYHPIIHRNTPLPVTRTDGYWTAHPHQTTVQIEIYQGEDEDALKNILVGDFC